MSDGPEHPRRLPAHPPGAPPVPPSGSAVPPAPADDPHLAGPAARVHPLDAVPTTRPEVPLHPLLPGGAGGEPLVHGPGAHQAPHAASSGPQEGARGALWFAVGVAVLVVVCLAGAALLVIGA